LNLRFHSVLPQIQLRGFNQGYDLVFQPAATDLKKIRKKKIKYNKIFMINFEKNKKSDIDEFLSVC